jgi:uncharacterized protein (TIGR00255 family)
MTGFGRATASLPGIEAAVEVASVNQKGLAIGVSLPREWASLERPLSERVRSAASRGKINVTIRPASLPGKGSAGPVDEAAVRAIFARMEALADELNIPFEPDARFLLEAASLARSSASSTELPEQLQPALEKALDQALAAFAVSRAREGAALRDDLLTRLVKLRAFHAAAAAFAPGQVIAQRDALLVRLRTLGVELDASDERVLKEVALFADRCDVAEELTRLSSHFDAFEALLRREDGEPAGRQLEFLAQEMHREINTTGAKSVSLDLTRVVLDMKNELERVREQFANVE